VTQRAYVLSKTSIRSGILKRPKLPNGTKDFMSVILDSFNSLERMKLQPKLHKLLTSAKLGTRLEQLLHRLKMKVIIRLNKKETVRVQVLCYHRMCS
jgi:hypothetical protein